MMVEPSKDVKMHGFEESCYIEVEPINSFDGGSNTFTNDEKELRSGTGCHAEASGSTNGEHLATSNEGSNEDDGAESLINDLFPDEILLYIFSFLSFANRCTISSVCKRWLTLVHDPSLWLSLKVLHEHKHSLEKVIYFIQGKRHLSSLYITNRNDCNVILEGVASHCPNLKQLEVTFSKGLSFEDIKALKSSCSRIEILNFEGSTLPQKDFTFMLSKFPSLRILNLSHCSRIDPNDLIEVAKCCSCLTELDIDYIYCNNSVLKEIIKYRKETLKKLLLDGEHVSNKGFAAIGACQNLEILGISFAINMTDVGLKGICELKKLKWLKLKRAQQLTREGLTKLLSTDNLKQVRYLDLAETSSINDATVELISKTCPFLVLLGLNWCWDVTDSGMDHIIARCKYLKFLDLTGLVYLTGSCFQSIPEKLPYLKMMTVEQCNHVTDKAMEDLMYKKPHLILVDYYGAQMRSPLDGNEEWFDHRYPVLKRISIVPDLPSESI